MRTGILGGSFNPPHNGHIYLAEKAKKLLELDRMFIIPAGIPPHKILAEGAENQDRFMMAKLAFEDLLGYNVLDIEMNGKNPSYTSETLLKLREMFPSDTFFLLMGCDMFITLEKWYKFQDVFRTAIPAPAARNEGEQVKIAEFEKRYKELFKANTEILTIKPYPVSSTAIRKKISLGLDFSKDIPPKVYQYISDKGLYLSSDEK